MSRFSANLLLILVALIWGSAFVPQIYGMAHVGPMTFTGVRFVIGSLVVAPLMWMEWRSLQREGRAGAARRSPACAVGSHGPQGGRHWRRALRSHGRLLPCVARARGDGV